MAKVSLSEISRGCGSFKGDLVFDEKCGQKPTLPDLVLTDRDCLKRPKTGQSLVKDGKKLVLPKTLLTRKGAIILYTPPKEILFTQEEKALTKEAAERKIAEELLYSEEKTIDWLIQSMLHSDPIGDFDETLEELENNGFNLPFAAATPAGRPQSSKSTQTFGAKAKVFRYIPPERALRQLLMRTRGSLGSRSAPPDYRRAILDFLRNVPTPEVRHRLLSAVGTRSRATSATTRQASAVTKHELLTPQSEQLLSDSSQLRVQSARSHGSLSASSNRPLSSQQLIRSLRTSPLLPAASSERPVSASGSTSVEMYQAAFDIRRSTAEEATEPGSPVFLRRASRGSHRPVTAHSSHSSRPAPSPANFDRSDSSATRHDPSASRETTPYSTVPGHPMSVRFSPRSPPSTRREIPDDLMEEAAEEDEEEDEEDLVEQLEWMEEFCEALAVAEHEEYADDEFFSDFEEDEGEEYAEEDEQEVYFAVPTAEVAEATEVTEVEAVETAGFADGFYEEQLGWEPDRIPSVAHNATPIPTEEWEEADRPASSAGALRDDQSAAAAAGPAAAISQLDDKPPSRAASRSSDKSVPRISTPLSPAIAYAAVPVDPSPVAAEIAETSVVDDEKRRTPEVPVSPKEPMASLEVPAEKAPALPVRPASAKPKETEKNKPIPTRPAKPPSKESPAATKVEKSPVAPPPKRDTHAPKLVPPKAPKAPEKAKPDLVRQQSAPQLKPPKETKAPPVEPAPSVQIDQLQYAKTSVRMDTLLPEPVKPRVRFEDPVVTRPKTTPVFRSLPARPPPKPPAPAPPSVGELKQLEIAAKVKDFRESLELKLARNEIGLEEMELELKLFMSNLEKPRRAARSAKSAKKGDRTKKKKFEKEIQQKREAARLAWLEQKERRSSEINQLKHELEEKEKERNEAVQKAEIREMELAEQMSILQDELREVDVAEGEARKVMEEMRRQDRLAREARRQADVERKRENLRLRKEEQKRMEDIAKRKEREMLERIATVEQRQKIAEEERRKREEREEQMLERLEEEERRLEEQAKLEEQRVYEVEEQAELEAMERLRKERERADKERQRLLEQAAELREIERRKIAEMEREKQRLEDERQRKVLEEEERRQEEINKLLELKRLEEETREKIRLERERVEAIRAETRKRIAELRRYGFQLITKQSVNKPWLYSYFYIWSRKAREKPFLDPKKAKRGLRSGKPKPPPAEAAPPARGRPPPPPPLAEPEPEPEPESPE